MIFSLVQDFASVLAAMPREHPRYRVLKLLDEAIRRDVHFIDRHPTTLFQCMWNTCWWFDCPDAAGHYDPPESGWPAAGPPWEQRDRARLARTLEEWRATKRSLAPDFPWLRSLRPPPVPLGGSLRWVLLDHTAPVTVVRFSPLGDQLATGGRDGTVRLWDPRTGRLIACADRLDDEVSSLAYTADGRRLAVASPDAVTIWDVRQGTALKRYPRQPGAGRSVCFSGDGSQIAYAEDPATVVIRDARGGGLVGRIRKAEAADLLAWSGPRNSLAVGGGYERPSLAVWAMSRGQQLFAASPNDSEVEALNFSPDGARLLFGRTVWDLDRRQTVLELPTPPLASGVFSPDGKWLIVTPSYGDRAVRVFSADAGEPVTEFRGHENEVQSVDVSPDGALAASGSFDRTVRVWQTGPGQAAPELRGFRSGIREPTRPAVTSDGDFVLAEGQLRRASGRGGGVLYDANSGVALASVPLMPPGPLGPVAVSAGRDLVAVRGPRSERGPAGAGRATRPGARLGPAFGTGPRDRARERTVLHEVVLLRLQTGGDYAPADTLEVAADCEFLTALRFSPDGARLGLGTDRGQVRVHDTRTRSPLAAFQLETPGDWPAGAVVVVAFHPSRPVIAAATLGGRVMVWDTDTGHTLHSWEALGPGVRPLWFDSVDSTRPRVGSPAAPLVVSADEVAVTAPDSETVVGWYPDQCGGDSSVTIAGDKWAIMTAERLYLFKLEHG